MEMRKIKERLGKVRKIIGFFLAFVLPAIAIEEDYYLIRTPLFSDQRWRLHHDWRLAGRRKSPLDVTYDRDSQLRSKDYYNTYIERKTPESGRSKRSCIPSSNSAGHTTKARGMVTFSTRIITSTGSSPCIQPDAHWTRLAASSPASSR